MGSHERGVTMWRLNEVAMTRSWEHDRLTHEVERTSGRPTEKWFASLDRWNAGRKGMLRTIAYLRDEQKLPHRLAATLAWNYFNPSTLPGDVADEIAPRH